MKYFVRKYKYFGQWSQWKEVSKEVAMQKSQVLVSYEGVHYCPYQIKMVEC
jgi:hypothetical protein